MTTIVTLQISTFAEIVGGATHFYGSLSTRRGKDRELVRLTHPLTLEEVKTLAKEYGYRVGEEAELFFSVEQVRSRAREQWRELCPGDLLVEAGHGEIFDPAPVLDGDAELADKARELWKRFDAAGGWDACGDEAVAEEAAGEWCREILGEAREDHQ